MNLIMGGAYQGKLSLAKRKYNVTDDQVFICTPEIPIDMSSKCIYHLEKYALYCVKNGLEAKTEFEASKSEWKDSVIICNDIFCGVVPIDDELRAAREMTGRLCIYLANEAEHISRMFCGLEQILK